MRRGIRDELRTCGVFVLVIGLFAWGYYRPEATRPLLGLTAALAHSASGVLNALGRATRITAQPQVGARLPSYTVHDERVAVDIAIDCNGCWAFVIFAAAVLAVRSTWQAKVVGLGFGVPALWAINSLRVVTLFYVADYAPSVFEEIHLYVWQFLIIAAALALLVLWAERFARPVDA